jgi:hypothetical protein
MGKNDYKSRKNNLLCFGITINFYGIFLYREKIHNHLILIMIFNVVFLCIVLHSYCDSFSYKKGFSFGEFMILRYLLP